MPFLNCASAQARLHEELNMRKGSLIDFNWISQVIPWWVLTAFPQVSREYLVTQKQILYSNSRLRLH